MKLIKASDAFRQLLQKDSEFLNYWRENRRSSIQGFDSYVQNNRGKEERGDSDKAYSVEFTHSSPSLKDREVTEDLIQSSSDKAFEQNVKTELKAGKPKKQALAIAYSIKEKNRMKEGLFKEEKPPVFDYTFSDIILFDDVSAIDLSEDIDGGYLELKDRESIKFTISEDEVEEILRRLRKCTEIHQEDYYKTNKFLKQNNLNIEECLEIIHKLKVSDYYANTRSLNPNHLNNNLIIFEPEIVRLNNGKEFKDLIIYLKIDLDETTKDAVALVSLHRSNGKNRLPYRKEGEIKNSMETKKYDDDFEEVLDEAVEDKTTTTAERLRTPRGTFRVYEGTWEDFKNEEDQDDWGFWFDYYLPEDAAWQDSEKWYKIMHNSKDQSAVAVLYKDMGKKLTESRGEDITRDLEKAIHDYYIKERDYTEEDYRELVGDYLNIKVKPYSNENGDWGTYVLVGAELGYSGFERLIDAVLDPFIRKYDKDAYFEMEDPGLASAIVWKKNLVECSESKLDEGIMSDIDIDLKDFNGDVGALLSYNEDRIEEIKKDIDYLKTNARKEIGRGGNFDSQEDLNSAISELEEELSYLEKTTPYVRKMKEEE